MQQNRNDQSNGHMHHENRHAPFETHIPNADTVVLLIHGILGSPVQFALLQPALTAAGYSTVALLLPGHGGNGKAFAQSSAAQWEAHVMETVASLSQRYRHILLVGHSMGGLLAIHAALAYPETVARLFCMALPLYTRISLRSMRMALFTMLGRTPRSTFLQAALAHSSITDASFWGYFTWIKNMCSLFMLSKRTRHVLHTLDNEIYLLFSGQDESVSRRSIRAARNRLVHCKHTVDVLPHSSHFLYSDMDKARLIASFEAFLRG